MNEYFRSILSYPWLAVYEGDPASGDPAGGGDPPGGGDPAGGDPNPGGGDPAGNKTFTQDQVNKMLAEDRRKHKAQVEQTVGQLEQLKKAKGLSDKERTELQGRIEELQGSLLTKEQLAAKEREKLQGEHKRTVETLAKERDTWQNRYVEATITRSITDEAVAAEAFNPSQIVALLKGSTRLVEVLDENGAATGNYIPKVQLVDTDKENKPVTLDLTVAEALKRMKDREDFANLFKSGVTGGLGGSGSRTTGKQVDPSKMTPEQWAAHRKTMGLGRKR